MRQVEAGLGLYDYNARYYDPYLNRFVSADTIVPDSADPQALNRYSYVNNNPVRYVDPTGHDGGFTDWDRCAWDPSACEAAQSRLANADDRDEHRDEKRSDDDGNDLPGSPGVHQRTHADDEEGRQQLHDCFDPGGAPSLVVRYECAGHW